MGISMIIVNSRSVTTCVIPTYLSYKSAGSSISGNDSCCCAGVGADKCKLV